MNKKWFYMIILCLPVIFVLLKLKSQFEMLSPETALNIAKQSFNNVEGSYIIYEPTSLTRFGQKSFIYKGVVNTEDKDYEFSIDAYTGELIDTVELA